MNAPTGAGDAPEGSVAAGRGWLILGLLALAFGPLLLEFFANLWDRPYYQFFPMALGGAVVLGRRGLLELPRPWVPGPFSLTVVLLGGSLGLLALAVVLWSPWLASLAAILCVTGLVWALGGWPAGRAILPALLLVGTFIPPPMALDAKLMVALRELAVQWSSRMLDLVGVVHALSGNVINLPQRQLLVEEACSGINSVLLTLATGIFYLFWRRRSWWRVVICLPFVLAGVLLGNVVRICFGAWLQFFHNHDILSGWKHETVGLILLMGYVVLIMSLDEWFEFLTQPVKVSPVAPVPIPAEEPATTKAPPRLTWPAIRLPHWTLGLAGVYALFGLLALGMMVHSHKVAFVLAGKSAVSGDATFTLPPKMGDWSRLEKATPFHKAATQGIYSQVWNYQNGSIEASIALDYPFHGYHDVTECYRLVGWSLDQQSQKTGALPDPDIPFMEVEMSKAPVSHGSLWFSTVDDNGHWLEGSTVALSWLDRWKTSGRVEASSYRVQLLVTGFGPLPPADQVAARQLFAAARQELARQLMAKLRGKS